MATLHPSKTMKPRTPYLYFLKKRRQAFPGIDFHVVIEMLHTEWATMSRKEMMELKRCSTYFVEVVDGKFAYTLRHCILNPEVRKITTFEEALICLRSILLRL